MRYLVLSDIHANLPALDAVLASAPAAEWDRAIVLGDLVGYGADPNEVIARVRGLDPLAVIRGNHDKTACGLEDGTNFNYVARSAAAWTLTTLSDAHRAYLRALPAGPARLDETLEICHGAPFDEDHYIFDANDADRALHAASRPLCLFGHTHLPVVFQHDGATVGGFIHDPDAGEPLLLRAGTRYLVNPGSVGQPRDGDPRAAYVIYDSDARSVDLRRTPYDVEAAQRRILAAGLPPVLANRLAMGR